MFGTIRYHFATSYYKNCDITPWRSNSHLLKKAIINVQTLGDRTFPSVLWFKYYFHINKTGNQTVPSVLWLNHYFHINKTGDQTVLSVLWLYHYFHINKTGNQTVPSVLWLNHYFHINKTGIFVMLFPFCIFLPKMITAHFQRYNKV